MTQVGWVSLGGRHGPVVAAWLLVTVAVAVLWGWLGRAVPLPDVPGARFQCLSYTPYRDDQTPFDDTFVVPRHQIEEDLPLLAPVTDCVRTYSSAGGLGEVVPIAKAQGMRVLVGTWIGSKAADNAKEIAATLEVVRAHPEAVRAIVVGNEVLLRREQTAEQLIGHIETMRRQTDFPLTYADVWEFWLKHPQVADHVDFMTIHILPYWEDLPVSVEQALAHMREILEKMRAAFPGKPILIGETGWPSAGRTREEATPGRVAQARFVREFIALTEQEHIPYNLIEAFDQPWKRRLEGTVGGHWGLFAADRQVKFPLTGPVGEYRHWPWAVGLGALAAAALLGWALRGRPRLGVGRALAVALLGHAMGALLYLQGSYAAATSINGFDWLLGLGGLPVIVAAVLSMVPLAAGGTGPWATARPAGLEAARGWLLRPSLAALTPELALGLLQAVAVFGAAVAALALAVDARYRDFPLFVFAAPALALVLRGRAQGDGPRPMEAWLALVMLGSAAAGVVIETPANREAMVWNAIVLLLALPWLPALAAELRRLLHAGR